MAIYIGSSKKTIRVGSSITRTLLIPELVSIVVTAPPTQTEYNPFTSFNPAGMVITAEYDNGEKKTITDYTITNGDQLTADMTSVTISYTARGITKTATQDIRVNHIKLDIPYSNDTFVYTGSEMTPVWTEYDSSLMTIGGDTSGTNAGTYTTNFALKDKINYTWADGTTADKSVTWTIGKAQASITLDKTSIVLNADKLSDTVTFSSVGMNSVMVMSSDMSVATVSMDGNVITISNVNETTGTAHIIISGEVDSNYNAPEYPSIAVSAEFVLPIAKVVFTLAGSAPNMITAGAFKMTINGIDQTTQLQSQPTYSLNIGDNIVFTGINLASIMVSINDEDGFVAGNEYIYSVKSNVAITVGGSGQALLLDVTEIPEGYALVQITGKAESTSYDKASVKIDGVTYTSSGYGSIDGTYQHVGYPTLAVPIGTIIECSITDSHDYTDGKITVNGTTVASKTATYNYEVIGDTSIYLYSNYYNSGYYNHSCGSITITEIYAVNLNTVANGTLTTTSTGAVGSTVTLTPTPDEGYMYGGATVTYTLNGVEQTIELDANTKTFTMPAADVTVIPVWSEKPSTAIVTVTHDAYDAQYWWSGCSATLPDGSYVSLNSAGTYELPIGTVITCEGGVYFSQSRSARMRIYLNEEIVAETHSGNTYGDGAVNYISYEYTLSKNITLEPKNDEEFTYEDLNKFGAIYITET